MKVGQAGVVTQNPWAINQVNELSASAWKYAIELRILARGKRAQKYAIDLRILEKERARWATALAIGLVLVLAVIKN